MLHDSFLSEHPEAVIVEQAAAQTNSRSNPVTYIGIMDTIRKIFWKANQMSPSLFSYKSKGGCPECKGQGFTKINLACMSSMKTACKTCNGKRYKPGVLAYTYKEKSISDVLNSTVSEALSFFGDAAILKKLEAMFQVGLDYLSLGQPMSTLSGGECQRMKLASEFYKKGSIYMLDEPSVGLPLSDLEHILSIMNQPFGGTREYSHCH